MAKRVREPEALFEGLPQIAVTKPHAPGATAKDLHADLNPEQRSAVEHVGPPLIVLAGPGTGKTRVMAHRVAELIHARGFAPESILVSTFTIKAAGELRERVQGLIGPALGERVEARTLHSFGARLVRRFLDRLGLPPGTTMIDRVQRRRLVKRVIREGGLFAHATGAGLDALAARVERAIDNFADAGVLADEAVAFARRQQECAGEAFGEQLGDARAVEARLALVEDFAACAEAYRRVTQEAWERGLLSFADLTVLPIKLLRDDAKAGAIVRAGVRAIVVDECQDCNPGQIRLIDLLAKRPGAGGGKTADVCVVGDDDQAIYAFRGADVGAFNRFAALWPDAQVATLTRNYRSHECVVKTSQAIIARAQQRFRPDKQLHASSRDAQGEGGVRVVTLRSTFDDAITIAAMLQARRQAALSRGARWRWGECAILARSHGDADRIEAALGLEGIPYVRRREPSLLDDAGVQDALAWMRWLVSPHESWAARRVLTRPPYAIDVATTAAWERAYRLRARRREVLEGEGGGAGGAALSFAQFLREQLGETPEGGAAPEAAQSLARVLEVHDQLAQRVAAMSGEEAVGFVLQRTGVAQAELLPGRERAKRIAALTTLLKLARAKQWLLDAPGDLAAFVRYFDELCETDEGLRSLREPGALDDAERTLEPANPGEEVHASAEALAAGDGVHIATAHGAKGLEFDIVFVPRVESPAGYPMVKGGGDDDACPWRMPAALVESCVGGGIKGAHADARAARLDEERRIFYVACTRAKRELVLLTRYQGKASKAAANYAQELWHQEQALGLVICAGDDQRREALSLGVTLVGASEDATSDDAAPRRARVRSEELIASAVRTVRERASRALEAAASARSLEELRRAEGLVVAATRLAAAVGAVERREPAPAWAMHEASADAALVQRLSAALTTGAAVDAGGGLPPPVPPLDVSYSSVDTYERCPRCWYARHVLGLHEAANVDIARGAAVHAALDAFYRRWAEADAEGEPRPGLEDLLREGRRAVASVMRTGVGMRGDGGGLEAATRELLHDIESLLRATFASLHTGDLHVLETERSVEFSYVVDGVAHRMSAKLDRIDQAGDARLRVVDYKTGAPRKDLLTPAPDDLQLGVYAMALRHAFGEDAPLGEAQYWLLGTGQRGVIAMDQLDLAGVRARIDAMVRGVLRGQFGKGEKCRGECAMLGAG